MNTKIIISGVLGGLCFFLLGWLMYGVLFKDMMSSMGGSATGVMRAESEMVWWALILGNLGFGFAFAYVLGSWSGVTTFMGGAKAAAMVGFLFELGYDLTYFATSNLMNLKGLCMDLVITIIMCAIAGGVIGWWLGRSN
jgi:hypothetical protein